MDPFMFGVLVFTLLFVAVVLRTILRWRGIWRWAASLPLVVLALAVLNVGLHPTSHNLLPFEIIIWLALGFFILGVVAMVRSRVLKEPKEESIRGHWAASPMLTVDKLRIYEQFDGDIDGWARASRGQATTGMTNEDWFLIDELLMNLATVKTGLASPSYAQQVEQRLLASTSDQATRSILHALATRRGSHNEA